MLYLLLNYLLMPTPLLCLLIDDDQDDQEIFALAIEDSGLNMQCVISNNASEALQRLTQDSTFYLIIFFSI